MLDIVRLGDFAKRRPSQLSGGQQQRVALARALVNLPTALLLDEPLAALDLKLRQAMQIELKRIQREVGITFIFVTHDQEEALTMSDRIAVMSQGRVEQIGTPEDIYSRPASVFVAGFIGSANLLPANVVVDADATTVVTDLEAGAQVYVGRARTGLHRRSGRHRHGPARATSLERDSSIELAVGGSKVAVTESIFQGAARRSSAQTAERHRTHGRRSKPTTAFDVRPGDHVWSRGRPARRTAA